MMTLFECQCNTIVSCRPSYISRNREMVKDLLGMLYNLYRPWGRGWNMHFVSRFGNINLYF
jgi:hypothetical protein